MPAKFKPSQIIIDRKTKKKSVQHFYLKCMPEKELFDYINSPMGKPKIKMKCRNELVRRGVKIVWQPKTT